MKLSKVQQSPRETLVRAGGALAMVDALRAFGVDPVEVLSEVGIREELLDDPDNLISYRLRGRLLAHCVSRTGCPHFGLLVGERMNLNSLGIVGVLIGNAPDVGAALDGLTRLLYLHAQGSETSLTVEGSEAILSFSVMQRLVAATDQLGDGALVMMRNIMRTLCGPSFRLAEVRFAHRKPEDVQPYRRCFRAPLRFDAEQNALVFSREWLSVRRPGSDIELQRVLQKQIGILEAEFSDDFPAQVQRVLRYMLPTDHGSAEEIAALFSIHPRTLGRRLEDSGTNFRELVENVRFEIARQMLEDTSRSIGQIAASLAYGRASAFTRAFRRWSGTTPVDWRAKHGSMNDRSHSWSR